MAKDAAKRNRELLVLTTALFKQALIESKRIDDSYIPQDLKAYVSPLINQTSLGFRETVFTIIIARLYGIPVDPTSDFYSCNPRALYEQSIRQVLERFRIPCGKSGPLNVAKNIKSLNEEWARNKRPEEAARAVAVFAAKLKPGVLSSVVLKKLALYYAKALLVEASRLKKIKIETVFGLSLFQHHLLYSELIKRAPDGGNTPQFIIGHLLEIFHKVFETNRIVKGVEISISATDITSKKPSDLWEVDKKSGKIRHLYEVTVKKVDLNRVKDSVRSLQALGIISATIIFLCRIPEDTKELSLSKNCTCEMDGFRYEFVDIFEWLLIILEKIGEDGRQLIYEKVSNFIRDFKTKESLKTEWNKLLPKISASAH